MAAKKMTMGLIVGNRGFFPDHLAKSGREEMLRVLTAAGMDVVALTPEESKQLAEALKRLTPKQRKRIATAVERLSPEGRRQLVQELKRDLAAKRRASQVSKPAR